MSAQSRDQNAYFSRYTNRQQDARAWSDRRGPFNKAYNDVEAAVTFLMHDWLDSPRNGKILLFCCDLNSFPF